MGFVAANVQRALIDETFAGAGDQEIVPAPGPGERIVVHGYIVVASAAGMNLSFRSADTDISGEMRYAAAGGAAAPFSEVPWLVCAVNEALDLNAAAAGYAGGHLLYSLEPVV